MSYILNALRKSEQERHSGQAPTLENRVLGHQEPQKHWKPWLVIALIAINLVTLSFFFWQKPDPAAESTGNSEVIAQATPSKSTESLKSRKNSSSEIETKVIELPLKKTPEEKQTSISDRVHNRKAFLDKQEQRSTLEERVSTLEDYTNKDGLTVLKQTAKAKDTGKKVASVKQESAEPKQPAVKSTTAKTVSEVSENTPSKHSSDEVVSRSFGSGTEETVPSAGSNKDKREVADQSGNTSNNVTAETSSTASQNIAKPAAKPAVKKAAKPKIPFFEQLPVEVRRKFPDLNINVFVYSEDPEDSFIMINMVKILPGQDISENTKLKKIERDSMIVEFEGKKVRIKRP